MNSGQAPFRFSSTSQDSRLSITNPSPNQGLVFDGSRFVNQPVVLNTTAIEFNLTSNSLRISNLESNLTANSVRITNLESNLSANSVRLSNVEAFVTSNVIRIANLESNLTANSLRITNLQSNLTANSLRITNLESNLSANSVRLSNVELFVTSNVTRIANLESNLTANSVRLSNVEAFVTSNVIRIGNLESNLTANSLRITNLQSNLTANSLRITNLESNLSANSVRLSNVEAFVTSNVIRIGNLESNLTANSLRITNVESNLSANSVRLSNVEAFVTSNVIRIGNLERDLDTAKTNIFNLRTDATSNSTRVDNLETTRASITSVNGAIATASSALTLATTAQGTASTAQASVDSLGFIVDGKANKSYVDTKLNDKVDVSDFYSHLNGKQNVGDCYEKGDTDYLLTFKPQKTDFLSNVTRIGDLEVNKVDTITVTNALSGKVDTTTFNTQMQTKVNTTTYATDLAQKVSLTTYDIGLSGKVDVTTYTTGLALKVDNTALIPMLAAKVDTLTFNAAMLGKADVSSTYSATTLPIYLLASYGLGTGTVSSTNTRLTSLEAGAGSSASRTTNQQIYGISDASHNDGEFSGHALNAYNNNGISQNASIWMGFDKTADIGYINSARYNSVTSVCLQTRGGKVGIGKTNPFYTLGVQGSIELGNEGTSGSRYVGLYNSYDGSFLAGTELESVSVGGNYSQNMHFKTHHYNVISARRMTIDYDGRVGIGTQSPIAPLHIVGSDRANSLIVDASATSPGRAGIEIRSNPGSGGHNWGVWGSLYNESPPAGSLSFYNNSTGTFAMALNPNGDTTHYAGVFANEAYDVEGGRPPKCGHYVWADKGFGMELNKYNGEWNTSILTRSDGGVIFRKDNTQLMTIRAGGNVGIGTTNPQYKLEVNGTARVSSYLTLGNACEMGIVYSASVYSGSSFFAPPSTGLYLAKYAGSVVLFVCLYTLYHNFYCRTITNFDARGVYGPYGQIYINENAGQGITAIYNGVGDTFLVFKVSLNQF